MNVYESEREQSRIIRTQFCGVRPAAARLWIDEFPHLAATTIHETKPAPRGFPLTLLSSLPAAALCDSIERINSRHAV